MTTKSLHSNPEFFKRVGQGVIDQFGLTQRRIREPKQAEWLKPVTVPDVNKELYRVRASRLIDLFPDELVIQEKAITIIRRTFMFSSTETLPVQDIGRTVLIDTPLFDGLHILGKNVAHDLQIKGLWPERARKAKEIIDGLLLEERETNVPLWLSNTERSGDDAGDELPRRQGEKAGKRAKL